MERRSKIRRSKRKLAERIIAFFLAFTIAFLSAPVNTAFAEGSTQGAPVTETPAAEDPVVEQPVVEQPVIEQPVVEEPVVEDPVVEEPVVEQPVVEEPVVEEPVVEEEAIEEETTEEEAIEEEIAILSDEEPMEEDIDSIDSINFDSLTLTMQTCWQDRAPAPYNFGDASSEEEFIFGEFWFRGHEQGGIEEDHNHNLLQLTDSNGNTIATSTRNEKDILIHDWKITSTDGLEFSPTRYQYGYAQPYSDYRVKDSSDSTNTNCIHYLPGGEYELTVNLWAKDEKGNYRDIGKTTTRKIKITLRDIGVELSATPRENSTTLETKRLPDGTLICKNTSDFIRISPNVAVSGDPINNPPAIDIKKIGGTNWEQAIGEYSIKYALAESWERSVNLTNNLDFKWIITEELDEMDNLMEAISVSGCTADESGTYWVTREQDIIIKPKYELGTKISSDGKEWQDELKVFVSKPTTITYYLKNDTYPESLDATKQNEIHVDIDLVPVTAELRYRGVSFSDIYLEDYSNGFFEKITENDKKLEVSYIIPKKTGSPITEIGWVIMDAGSTPENISNKAVTWETKIIRDNDYVTDQTTGKASVSGTIEFDFDKTKNSNVTFGSKVVWFRITDGSGNHTYISTDNIIVYEDLKTDYNDEVGNATYRKAGTESSFVELWFTNDNEYFPANDYGFVEEVYIDTIVKNDDDTTELGERRKLEASDYEEILDSMNYNYRGIRVFAAAFTDATVDTEYDITVQLKPYGKAFVTKYDDMASENDAPTLEQMFRVKVGQADSSIKINLLPEKVYDGTEYKDYSFEKTEGGTVKVYFQPYDSTKGTYYANYPEDKWDANIPVNVGKYVMKAVLDYDDKYVYKDSVGYAEFEITPRPVSATITVQETKKYDGTKTAIVEKVVVDTKLDKTLELNPEIITAEFESADVGDNKKIIVSDKLNIPENSDPEYVYKDGKKGNYDSFENYDITHYFTNLARITPAEVKITLKTGTESLDYVYGDPEKTPSEHISNIVNTNGVTVEVVPAEIEGMNLESIKDSLTYATNANNKSVVGDYVINARTSDPNFERNYKFEVVSKLEIVQREAVIEWIDVLPEYYYIADEYEVNAEITPAFIGDMVDITYKTTEIENVVKQSDGTYTYTETDKVTDTNTASAIGWYKTEIRLSNDNYKTDKCLIWEIKEFNTNAVPTITPTVASGAAHGTVNGWYNASTLTVNAPSEYMIAKDSKLNWRTSFDVKNLGDGVQSIEYYLMQTSTGYVTNVKGLQVAMDRTAPTGALEIIDKKGSFGEALNNILGYLFAKEIVSFIATFDDGTAGSGVVEAEYAYVDYTATNASQYSWKKVNISSGKMEKVVVDETATDVENNEKAKVLVVRLTDKAGNTSLINSAGMYIYQDATYSGTGIIYNKMSTEGVSVPVTFNNNKVKEIKIYKNETELVNTLIETDQYVVGTDEIEFKQAAFDGLETYENHPEANYTIVVSFNPLGKEVIAGYDLAREPEVVKIPLTVGKAIPTLMVEPYRKVFDGQPVNNLVYITNSEGAVTINYYIGEEIRETDDYGNTTITYKNTNKLLQGPDSNDVDVDGNTTELIPIAPRDAGFYYAVVNIAEDATYKAIDNSGSPVFVQIDKKGINAYIDIQSRVYDGTTDADVVENVYNPETQKYTTLGVRVETGIPGEDFIYQGGLEPYFVTKNVGTNIEVKCQEDYETEILYKTLNADTKKENYDIKYHISRANITKRELQVTIENLRATYGSVVDVDSVNVTNVSGLVNGESFSNEVSIGYKPIEKKHVVVDENGVFNNKGHSIDINDLSWYSKNYTVKLSGNPQLIIEPREARVNWMATNNGKDFDLKDPTARKVETTKTKYYQEDTVIYNGQPYTVSIKDLSNIIDNDKVIHGITEDSQVKQTKPGKYTVTALELNDSRLSPTIQPGDDTENQNLDYVILNENETVEEKDFYNGSSNKKHYWKIKYLDDYYGADGITDTKDSSHKIKVNEQVQSQSVKADDESGFGYINTPETAIWSNVATTVVKPATSNSKIYQFTDGETAHPEPGEDGNVNYGDGWKDSITLTGEAAHNITYAIKNSEGYITSVRKTQVNIDTTSPTATIKVEDKDIAIAAIDKIFDFFFGNKITVKIKAEDKGTHPSGFAAIDYVVAGKDDTVEIKNGYIYLNGSANSTSIKNFSSSQGDTLSIEIENNKNYIVAKVMDRAGNYTIINSKGLVVYDNTMTDKVTQIEGNAIVLTRPNIKDDLSVDILTNDYPVASVRLDTLDVNADTDTDTVKKSDPVPTDKYTWTPKSNGTNTLTIKQEYLKDLQAGKYNFVVKYKPLEEEWKDTEWSEGFDAANGHGEKPTETTISVEVKKSPGKVEFIGAYGHTYNGDPIEKPVYETVYKTTNVKANVADHIVTYSDKKDSEGNYINYTDSVPVNAGTYSVKVSVPEDEDYYAASEVLEFTIDKAEISVELPVEDKVYDSYATAELKDSIILNTGIKFEQIQVVNPESVGCVFVNENQEEDANVGKDKAVIIKSNVEFEGVGDANIANYDVKYTPSTADIIKATAHIVIDGTVTIEYGDDIPTTEMELKELVEITESGLWRYDELDTYEFKTVSVGTEPGAYDLELVSEDLNPNYNVELVGGKDALIITKRIVDIGWFNALENGNEASEFKTSFDYDGLEHNVTPKITNRYIEDDYDDIYLDYDGATGKDVKLVDGKYVDYVTKVTALKGTKAHCYDLPRISEGQQAGNFDTAKTNKSWNIVYNADDADEYAVFDEEKWYNAATKISAPEGYEIARGNTVNADWDSSFSYDNNTTGIHTVSYYLKNEDTGAITDEKTVTVKIDKEVPGGSIKAKNSVWNSLVEVIFGEFFNKGTLNVTIDGTDEYSGIDTIKYLYSDKVLSKDDLSKLSEDKWTALTVKNGKASFDMDKTRTAVYAKITDKAGNVTVMNTKGLVVFVDSDLKTEGPLEYTKDPLDTKTTVKIQTELFGNTIKEIVLDKDTDNPEPVRYTVQDDPEEEGYALITILNEYLQTVSAGTHTITISYNPQGEAYTGTETDADAPADTIIELKVYKNKNVPISIKENQFYYTGKPIELEVETESTSEPEVKYLQKVGSEFIEIENVPTEAGTYKAHITTEEEEFYLFGEAFYLFEINPCAVEVKVVPKTILYGQDIPNSFDFEIVSPTELPNGDTKEDLELVFNAEYTVNDFGKVDADEYDVDIVSHNENYDIDFAYRGDKDVLIIKPLPITVEWGETSFEYTNTEHSVTPRITNLIQGETCEMEFDGTLSAVDADKYEVEIEDVLNDNYTVDGVSDEMLKRQWTISYNQDVCEADAIYAAPPASGWYTSNVELKAPDGYEISLDDDPNGTWPDKVTISTEGDQDITYYLKKKTNSSDVPGPISQPKTVDIPLDKTGPKGIITIKQNEFKTFMSDITFGLFFKENVDVAISGSDAHSGIDTIKYMKSAVEMTEDEVRKAEESAWTTGKSFSIGEEQQVIVYAKITDKAGHVTVINSDGVVVYTDVEQSAIEADDYVKTTKEDVVVNITLNGNTVKAVTYNGVPLEDDQCEVKGGKLIFKGEYLDKLAADTHNFVVSYHTGGIVNAPVEIATTTVSIEVQRKPLNVSLKENGGTVTVIADSILSVDVQNVVADNIAEGHSVQSINITGTTTTVTEDGRYTLSNLVIVDSNGNNVTDDYNISYALGKLIVEHNPESQPFNMEVTQVKESFKADDELTKNDILVEVTYKDGYKQAVTNYDSNIDEIDMSQYGPNKIEISYTENGKIVTDDLAIYVNHNPASKPVDMTATLADTEYVAGEELNLDGIGVEVTYADGFKETVTDYVVDKSGIDMTQCGDQFLKVSYTANRETVTEEITIKVAHDPESIPSRVEVTQVKESFIAGDELSEDDILVEVIYEDGYRQAVTGYESNIDDIDMSKIGQKTIDISYTENDATVTSELTIEVNHNPESGWEAAAKNDEFTVSTDSSSIPESIDLNINYEDGHQETITGRVTNVDEIDMSKPGAKTLEVSYTYGDETFTNEFIIFVVNPSDDSGSDDSGEGDSGSGDSGEGDSGSGGTGSDDSGLGRFEIIHGENAPATSITNKNVDELLKALLTDEEEEEVEDGVDYKIYLEVTDISGSVNDTDKGEVQRKMAELGENTTLGAYIDISLYTKVGDNGATKITNSGKPISVTIEIPEGLLNDSNAKNRTYYIVRVHETDNGNDVEIIGGRFNRAEGTFTFETDRFSTYAIIYKDTVVNTGNGGNGAGGYYEGGSTSSSTTTTNKDAADALANANVGFVVPKTGDDATPFVWSMTLLAAMSAFAVCVNRISRKKRQGIDQ